MAIEFSKEERKSATHSIQRFFEEELEMDIGELQASFLLDFFNKELSPIAYNKGVDDAKTLLSTRLEDIDATCFEQPFSFWSKK